jgi:hypothetical protein
MKSHCSRTLLLSGLAILLALPLLSRNAFGQTEPKFTITPVAEKKLSQLPAGDLFWRIESFSSLQEAKAAESPLSMCFEAGGKVWLVTLAAKDSMGSGTKVAEVGPVPRPSASEYLLRVTHSGGPPGAKTPVHTHPGPEAFYVLAGRLGQKTPHGVSYAEAGQTMNGHGADTPMEVFSAGSTPLDQIVMFIVDPARPFSVPAKFD